MPCWRIFQSDFSIYRVFPDNSTEVAMFNEGYCRLYGYTKTEMEEHVLNSADHGIYPDDLNRMLTKQTDQPGSGGSFLYISYY